MYLLIKPAYNGVLPFVSFQNQYRSRTLRCSFFSFDPSPVFWDVLVDAVSAELAVDTAVGLMNLAERSDFLNAGISLSFPAKLRRFLFSRNAIGFELAYKSSCKTF